MSLPKLFQNWLWKNKQVERTTPLNSTNLQKINDAIDGIDDRVITLDNSLTDLSDETIHKSGGTFNPSVTLYGAGRLGISTNSNLALEGSNINLKGNVDIDGTLYVGGEDVHYDGTNFKVNVPAYMYETTRTGDTYLGVTKAYANVYIGSGYRPHFYVRSITSDINSQHGTTISAGNEDDTLVNDIDIVNYGGNINLNCKDNSSGISGIATYNGNEIASASYSYSTALRNTGKLLVNNKILIQWGTYNISGSGTIVFPTAFNANCNPAVVCSRLDSGDNHVPMPKNVFNTGFDVGPYPSGVWESSAAISWVAYGFI